jgi:hypothetical protein
MTGMEAVTEEYLGMVYDDVKRHPLPVRGWESLKPARPDVLEIISDKVTKTASLVTSVFQSLRQRWISVAA